MRKMASILVVEVKNPSEINNALIRERAERCKERFSIQHVAIFNGDIVGFLSFDNKSHIGFGVIYEIYVLPDFRSKGVGAFLLRHGEQLALHYKCQKILVCPEAFDGTVLKERLVVWYGRHGYKFSEAGCGEMEKVDLQI